MACLANSIRSPLGCCSGSTVMLLLVVLLAWLAYRSM